MFFNFISSPLGQLFSVLEMQEGSLIVNVVLLVSRLATLYIGGRSGDVIHTLVLFSASGVVVYGGLSLCLTANVGVSPARWLLTILRWLLLSTVVLSASWLVCFALGLRSWALLVVYGIAALAYYSWVLLHDRQLLNSVQRLVKRQQ
jgi:hypothetical protein